MRGSGSRGALRVAALAVSALLSLAACVPPASQAIDPPDVDGQRRAVVFVPGWALRCGTSPPVEWSPWTAALDRRGYGADRVAVFPFEQCDPIEQSAGKLDAFVAELLERSEATEVDIVAHSMGSLIARWCIEFGSCGSVTANFVSLSGANHGTELARFCPIQFWSQACGAMTPDSDVLRALNDGDETPGDIRYQTWVSWCETVILPNSNVAMRGAENHLVTDHCVLHDDWKRDYALIPVILASLGIAPPTAG